MILTPPAAPPAPAPRAEGFALPWPARRIGGMVLALSFILRAVLAYRGGQLFWPEEDHFDVSRQLARALLNGQLSDAPGLLFGHPEHLFFKILGLVPALAELLLGAPGWIAALFFAAASTWVIWLIGRVARAAGASETEAVVALLLAAATTSLLYYSRHFLPYDLALGFFLLSLPAGLRPGASGRSSFLAGLCLALGCLTYNGYWLVGAVLLVVHVLLALPGIRPAATRAGWALLGLALPVLAVAGVSQLFGHDFFALTLAAAGQANQGEFDQTWLFVLQYLWSAEHGLALLWGLALLLALNQTGRRHLLWPCLTITFALVLILPAESSFPLAVTARLVRILTPFLCLTAAAALCLPPSLGGRPRLVAGVLGLVLLQAAVNFSTPLLQVFPREFEQLARDRLAVARRTDLGPYTIFNAGFLHNPGWAPAGPDPGTVLLRRSHPFQFEPYLFEGYPSAVRARFLERDLSMRVVRLAVGGPPQAGYPGGLLELTLRFPPAPLSLLPEPLLSTGAPGRGDALVIRYEGSGHFVLGHDHMGGGAAFSPRLPLARGQTHRVLIGMDSLYPPGTYPRPPRRFVLWDDTVLLRGRAELHPTAPDQIAIGQNFIGVSTATLQLSAEIVGFRRIPAPAFGPAFKAPPGALHLRLLLPPDSVPGRAEPLLSSGPAGRGDVLFLQHEPDGRFRLGHDHWGTGAVLSEPFALDVTRPADLVLEMAPFVASDPAADNPGDSRAGRLFARCNGEIIFNRQALFHASAASDLSLGENRAGSTGVDPVLDADVLAATPVPPEAAFAEPGGYPGALRLVLAFSGPFPAGRSEPILCTGRTGAGDLLFIRFDGQGNFQVGHDHWGMPLALSAPHPFDPARPLDLTVALGSLLPPAGDPLQPTSPDAARLRDRLFVAAGGTVLLDQPAQFHPALPASRVVGFNRIGSSSAGERLGADLREYSTVAPAAILPLLSAP